MNAIRVLMLDDDIHAPTYHAEDTTSWHNPNDFIKWLTRSHTTATPYEVRLVYLIDLDIDFAETDPDIDIGYLFDIVFFGGRGHSFEEYQEAFNILWENSEEI